MEAVASELEPNDLVKLGEGALEAETLDDNVTSAVRLGVSVLLGLLLVLIVSVSVTLVEEEIDGEAATLDVIDAVASTLAPRERVMLGDGATENVIACDGVGTEELVLVNVAIGEGAGDVVGIAENVLVDVAATVEEGVKADDTVTALDAERVTVDVEKML